MPSRADTRARTSVRIWLERVAQAIALLIVVALLVEALRGEDDAGAAVVDTRGLPAALERWSTVAAPERVHVNVDGALAPPHRAWLAALEGSGTHVSWSAVDVPAVAVVAEPLADPAGGTVVLAAAPRDTMLVLEDAHGVLDSVETGAHGARFLARSAPPDVRLRLGGHDARSTVRDSLVLGRILLLGSVGWEAKFVAAALEERGWPVDARLALSPKGDVSQGPAVAIDTARYAAVVVLDTTALVHVPRIARYVRDGGGLVIAAGATRPAAFAALRAGQPGGAIDAVEPFDPAAPEPRRALGLTPIVPHADAIPLERRGEQVAVAARRVGRGRIAVVGYEDTWRWRMGGGDAALEDHRAWWAGLVASVVHVGREARGSDAMVDEAPLARLMDVLGPPSPVPAELARRAGLPHDWLLAILGGLLLLAWLSRRLRGAA